MKKIKVTIKRKYKKMYNPAIKLKANIEAIRIALKYKSGDIQTAEDIQAVSEFSGWGGIKCVLYDPYNDAEWQEASQVDKKLQSMLLELHELLMNNMDDKEYREAISSIKAAILTSFYTPEILPSTFYKVLKDYTDVTTIYEPSAGGGVFLATAMKELKNLERAVAYEKDIITGRILRYLSKSYKVPCAVHICGFEESSQHEDGKFDLCVSNVPFGTFPVYDPIVKDRNITGKIHAYFMAKMITKVKDGGIVVALVTNAFLDSPSNRSARKHLFSNSDFISLSVMPDNLMKESANTEAGSHFLVVRRRYGKTEADMSDDELRLCESTLVQVHGITVPVNKYVQRYRSCVIGKQVLGKNQYGKASVEIIWNKPIADIAIPFEKILRKDFEKRMSIKSIVCPDDTPPWEERKEISVKEEPKFDPLQQLNQINILSSIFKSRSEWDEQWGKEQFLKSLEKDVQLAENQVWSTDGTGSGVIDRIEKEEGADPIISSVKSYLPEQIVTSGIPLIPGTIIQVTKGDKDLFTKEVELVQVESVGENGVVQAVTAPIKKGRETELMSMYLNIRDAYVSLEIEENKKQ